MVLENSVVSSSTSNNEQRNDDVHIFVPQSEFHEFINSSGRHLTGSKPFEEDRINMLSKLGYQIMHCPALRSQGDAVAIAYWMRRSNLEKIKKDYYDHHTQNPNFLIFPVGKVFHIAPSNVDSLFLYSWALSFLCGNLNIVRLSSSQNKIVTAFLDCLIAIADMFPELMSQNLFLTCPHDSNALAVITQLCSHRVVWGGDETIYKIRSIPLPAYASERCFATKHSYSVISASAVTQATVEEIAQLSRNIYNDIFQYNQKACSSPQILFWLSSSHEVYLEATRRLEAALSIIVAELNNESPSISDAVERFSYACLVTAERPGDVQLHEGVFASVAFAAIDPTIERESCGTGFLRHVPLSSLRDLDKFFTPSDQTITYYGLSKIRCEELLQIAASNGIDRIVPVGRALDLMPVWDGFDLIGDFIRRVEFS